MVDKDIIVSKAADVRKHVNRVLGKNVVNFENFKNDVDLQDIIYFNIQMAIQNCIDIAAHIISDEGYGVPGSNSEMFYILQENGYLDTLIVEKMIKAVGFRNLIVHEYGILDIEQVFEISNSDIKDLLEYIKAVFKRAGIAP